MKNKRNIGFTMRTISPIALGFITGNLVKNFGNNTIWYVLGIVAMTASILVGFYLENK